MKTHPLLARLLQRGVILPAPHTVGLGDDIDPERFSPGVVLHPGCRLTGAAMTMGPDCVIGAEGPAVLNNTQFGARVRFQGGYAENVTLLDDAVVGSGAHLRPGTLMEEQATVAHTAGLKQTILMPYVALGSLVNFCDCLMAGGTGPERHSEVGSGYVHFNFTPHQDKAAPSLIGDVPRGVLLDQNPIFLGGQGGLVGPLRIAYGVVVAAGTVCRRDHLLPDTLVTEPQPAARQDHPYDPHRRSDLGRILSRNVEYIGNLAALEQWYRHARTPFAQSPQHTHVLAGARQRIAEGIQERLRQLDRLHRVLQSAPPPSPRDNPCVITARFLASWPVLRDQLEQACAATNPKTTEWKPGSNEVTGSYLDWVHGLDPRRRVSIRETLQQIVTVFLEVYSRFIDANVPNPPSTPAHPQRGNGDLPHG